MLDPSQVRALVGWSERVDPALRRALLSFWVLVLCATPHLARFGTTPTRLAAQSILVLATVGVLVVLLRQRLRRPTSTEFIRRVRGFDRQLAERIARATRLRARGPTVGTSASLALCHLRRLVAEVPLWALEGAARLRARHLMRLSFFGWLCSLALVLLEPLRLLEGSAVLVSEVGKVELPVEYLELTRLTLHRPEYLKLGTRELGRVESLTEPAGTVLEVRGLARHPGRQLMVSDGHREVLLVDDGAGQLLAKFPCERSGRLSIVARFGEVRLSERHAIELRVIEDRPPLVELELEGDSLDLTRAERAVLGYRITDDHGVSQVELRLRAGPREERRLLAELDGSRSAELGGLLLDRAEPILASAAFPIELSIRARDNGSLGGGSWGESRRIRVLVPELGERESARLAALGAVRDTLAQLLALALAPSLGARNQEAALLDTLEAKLSVLFGQSALPRGLQQILEGRASKLTRAGGVANRREELALLLLFVDEAIETLGSRDARRVALGLAELAQQVREAARTLRAGTTDPRPERELNVALQALGDGAGRLQTLAGLGGDLSRAVHLASARFEGGRKARDWRSVEVVGAFLAERLRQAAPNYGWRGTVGVEMANGTDELAQLRLSELDVRFDRLNRELERLIEDHGVLIERNHSTTSAVDATRAPGEWSGELAVHAQAITKLSELLHTLPQDSIESAAFTQLAEALRKVRDGLGRAELIAAATELERALVLATSLEDGGAASSAAAAVTQKLELGLTIEHEWARGRAAALRNLGGARLAEDYRRLAEGESELTFRTEQLVARERATDAVLPEASVAALGQAIRLMRSAQAALLGSLGAEALVSQREAQRLLEQCAVGGTFGASSGPGELDPSPGLTGLGSERLPMSTTPTTDPLAREKFRRRVQESLGNQTPPLLHDSVSRYVEGLLR